jgi:glycosyltransferase involved in cell wall biosynthesis
MNPRPVPSARPEEVGGQAATGAGNTPNGAVQALILTGGFDKPYAYGLATALAAHGVSLQVVGSDDVDCPEMHTTPGITFRNFLRSSQPGWSLWNRSWNVARYYARLLIFVVSSPIRIVHVLWNGKLAYFDRTILAVVFKAVGKRVAFTAHNINAKRRDGGDSWWNRWTLRVQYRLADSIFVHTAAMAQELTTDFAVPAQKITVIPFGINNSIPVWNPRSADCRRNLGIDATDRVILFFGSIRPYKGLHYLIEALELIAQGSPDRYRLLIAGAPHKEDRAYWSRLQAKIARSPIGPWVIERSEYIPDADIEQYFMAADLLALPYTHVYQSGVLFLGYSFGLPAVTSRAGSFEEEVIEHETGFVAETANARDLARAITQYFQSDLYRDLGARRARIKEFAQQRYSWDVVADRTVAVYKAILQ